MSRILLFLLCFSISTWGTTYYVDFDGGSDSNDGLTRLTPFHSLPGMRTGNGGSPFVSSSYGGGTFSAGVNTVPDNTTFKIKYGTVWDSSDGGVFTGYTVSGEYWRLGYTNVVIEGDSTWGTAGVRPIIRGAGLGLTTANSLGMFAAKLDGLTVDNLQVLDSPITGLYFSDRAGGGPITNLTLYGLVTTNHGTSFGTDAAGADSGHIKILDARGAVILSNIVMHGNSKTNNGIVIGDSGKYANNVLITGCSADGFRGDEDNNDAGIGYKALNSTIVLTNFTTFDNLKGWDFGEHNGGGATIDYLVINGSTYSNSLFGGAFNSVNGPYSPNPKFKMGNVFVGYNGLRGIKSYAAPFSLKIVHSGFWLNGRTNDTDSGHLNVTPNSQTDSSTIDAVTYNCIFGPTRGPTMISTGYGAVDTTDFTWLLDYNAYNPGWSPNFCKWSYFQSPAADYNFGANGPGHASGNWWSQYGTTTTPPAQGTGHFHSDAHSIGTGCDNTTLATFDLSTFAPGANYPGRNLTLESWHEDWMDKDRNGTTRTFWTMGMVEFASGNPVISTITDKSILHDTQIAIPFTASDAESAITITRTSSDTTLLPLANAVITGSTPNYTLTLTPAPTLTGQSTVRVTATDTDTNSAYTQFTFSVTNSASIILGGGGTTTNKSKLKGRGKLR